MNSKERFLAVINGAAVDKTPVFPLLMGFSAQRLGASYRQFASNGHVLAEAQLKTREVFKVDAITACSDAFRISADLGGEIVFPEDKPPFLANPLVESEADFKNLRKPDVTNSKGRMADRVAATREMVQAAGNECMVLGWVDMPFAEACSICGVTQFLMLLYDDPEFAHKILLFLTEIVIEFAIAQITAGAPMVGAGDAAASLISPQLFREFALPYEQKVCEEVHKAGGLVKLHICGNTTHLIKDMILSGADLFNIDHLVDLSFAIENYSQVKKAYKGNLNPVADLLQSTPEESLEKALKCLDMAKGTNYMLSPGCEVPAEVSDDVFLAFCKSVDHV